MSGANKTITFIKTIFVFTFAFFIAAFKFILDFLFSDTDTVQKTSDPLSQDPSLNWGDTHDDGWID